MIHIQIKKLKTTSDQIGLRKNIRTENDHFLRKYNNLINYFYRS